MDGVARLLQAMRLQPGGFPGQNIGMAMLPLTTFELLPEKRRENGPVSGIRARLDLRASMMVQHSDNLAVWICQERTRVMMYMSPLPEP